MPSAAHSPQNAHGARDFVKQSSLYQEFLAEREEILRHKWLESERLGYDIGFERALLDWIRKHRDSWRAARRSQSGANGRTPSPFATLSVPSSPAHAPGNGHGKENNCGPSHTHSVSGSSHPGTAGASATLEAQASRGVTLGGPH